MVSFSYNDFFIPIQPGNAVHKAWTKTTNYQAKGVTWHWTAMAKLKDSRKTLQGLGSRKVSAHFCVGSSFAEGVDRYVSLENRSWHAQVNQKLRWDGEKSVKRTSGISACIGVETAHVGYERQGYPASPDWGIFLDPTSETYRRIPPWGEEQFKMMVEVGKQILDRWPYIPWQHHHGHHDICPGYKTDVVGFDFARLLRRIYDNPKIPDVWTPLWTTEARQRVLISLGYDLGEWLDDGFWGDYSKRALTEFQREHSKVITPFWTTFTCQDAHREVTKKGLSLETIATAPA